MLASRGIVRLGVITLAAALGACGGGAGLNAPRPNAGQELPLPDAERKVELRLDNGLIEPGSASIAVQPEIDSWVRQETDAINAYYGRFPAKHTRLLIERLEGSGVRWARTFAFSGPFVRVGLGGMTSPSELASDWMLTHEFIHLALPQFADAHDWLQEGAATYVEPVARAQAGLLPPERVWAAFVRDMPQGLPGARDRGLDFTPTWGRIYWGGALFCLVADVEIRKRTDNRFGLQDALRAILADGGTLDRHWSIADALRSGDRATGVNVLMETYDQWRAKPVKVDLAALWRELGIDMQGRRAVLRDDAPLAEIRRAITTARVDD